MTYNGKEFKPYDNRYYVSADGEVYSTYKNGVLKPCIDRDGYHRVDIHSAHMKVHKLVFLTWVGEIEEGKQLNHKDDNKNNNHYSNLYQGTQKENMKDCLRNGKRANHFKPIVIYDKEVNKVINFPSIKNFISYTGHSVANGSVSHCKEKKWFRDRYVIMEDKV